MFPILHLGPLAIPLAPMILLLGFFVSASLIEYHAARLGLDRTAVSNMMYIGFGAALVGARLGYVVMHLDAYLRDPLGIVVPTPATLDALWGIVCGITAGALYGWKAKLVLWRTLDALVPGIAGIAFTLGISHLASGDAFGAPARLPWSIYLWDDYRHPSQMYEIIAAAILFAVWWFLRDRKIFDGGLFLVVIALYAASVILLEAFRGDSWLLQGWRIAQLMALVALALSLVALRVLSQRASDANTRNSELNGKRIR